jgi:hypothetical protein
MAGGLFANTFESVAPKFTIDGQTYMKYRGQASEDFQKDYFGGLKINNPGSFNPEIIENENK